MLEENIHFPSFQKYFRDKNYDKIFFGIRNNFYLVYTYIANVIAMWNGIIVLGDIKIFHMLLPATKLLTCRWVKLPLSSFLLGKEISSVIQNL